MTYASTVIADGAVAYWRLGEPSGTTADNAEGTSSRDGTYTGSPTLGTAGIPGGGGDTAMTLDGSNSKYMVASSYTTIPTPPLSLECWVKMAGAPSDTAICGWFSQAGVLGCQIYLAGPTDNIRIGTEQGNANDAAPGLLNGSWHHIVGTIDGTNGNARIYYDGALLAGPSAVTFNGGASLNAFRIGTYPPSATSVNGTIDEVAVYPTALSAGTITAHYNLGITASGPVWTTPADTVSMSTTPELKFNSPASAVAQHFYLQLDTANTFNTGNLRNYDSSTSQTNWDYWNGSAWTALPSTGLASGFAGNEIRYTVTSALSAATWYRRVRAGTLV